MPNSYSPPPTINFFTSAFNSTVIYYNLQIAHSAFSTSSTSPVNLTCFTPDVIPIPIPGDYLIMTTTDVIASGTVPATALYQWEFSKSGQSTFDVADVDMEIVADAYSASYSESFTRLVTFPVAGNWTLTQQIFSGTGGATFACTHFVSQWITTVFGLNPVNAINTQFTQFLDANYTLMTNMDTNAQWGSLTNGTVTGYANTLATHGASLTTLTNNLNSLSTTVDSLSNVSKNSGGIRIKP